MEVSVNQIGIRQRLQGGPIRPVNAKMLTIPAQPDAYGKTAGEFGNLEFKMVLDPSSGHMRAALVEKKGTPKTKVAWSKSKKDGRAVRKETVTSASTGLPIFWLARSVNQQPNANVFPSDAEFLFELDKGVDALIK